MSIVFGVYHPVYTRARARTTTSCIWYLYTYKQTLLRYFGSLAESVVLFAKPSCRGRHRRRLRPCHSRFSRSTRGLPYYSNISPFSISSISVFRIFLTPSPTFRFRRDCLHVGSFPKQYWTVVYSSPSALL